jgi:hypothetical protein
MTTDNAAGLPAPGTRVTLDGDGRVASDGRITAITTDGIVTISLRRAFAPALVATVVWQQGAVRGRAHLQIDQQTATEITGRLVPEGDERRGHVRTRPADWAFVRSTTNRAVQGRLVDHSAGGCAVRVRRAGASVGDEMTLEVLDGWGRTDTVTARVIRITPDEDGYVVEFAFAWPQPLEQLIA